MSNADPPQEVVSPTAAQPAEMPSRSPLDEAFRTAAQLEPDDQLRLIARLWKSLPADHREALVTLQLEEAHGDRPSTLSRWPTTPPLVDSLWPKVYARLFDPGKTSELYSAPRRFDLATIFVVTAAFSLLLGGMAALDAHPIVMVVVTSLLAVVAATQALFREVANPRGISIVTGAAAFTLMCWIIMFSTRYILPRSLFVNTFILGIPCGAFFGYLAGTLVGGIFLVADRVRNRLESKPSATSLPENGPSSPFDEAPTDSVKAE